MEKELIILREYCENTSIEFDFIEQLENEGLLNIQTQDNVKCIMESQLSDLKMFSRLYYDLSINIAGIDVINNLLKKIRKMEDELTILRTDTIEEQEIDFLDSF